MQKDIHFYLSYTLARKVGFDVDLAAKIAWANQYTDELTEAELHGIQTQCNTSVVGNWHDKTVQRSVLVPFHFVPGDDQQNPWAVTANSKNSVRLLNETIASMDIFRFGIALHTFQDTFSHQGWTGWEEKFNSCNWFGHLPAPTPNIGHTDKGMDPDIANFVWTDPRTGWQINNKDRAVVCAELTCLHLQRFLAASQSKPAFTVENQQQWNGMAFEFKEIFEIASYDKRIDAIIELIDERIWYAEVNAEFKGKYKQEFIRAANRHLATVMELIKDLPGPA